MRLSEHSETVPNALEPAAVPGGVNRAILLHRGPAVLRAGDDHAAALTGNVAITLDWRPSPGVRFRFLPLTGNAHALDPLANENLVLTLPDTGASTRCDVFSVRHTIFAGSGTEGDVLEGVLQPLELGTPDRLSELRFNVANFVRAGGRPIRYQGGRVGGGRRIMQGSGWLLVMDAIDEQHPPGFGTAPDNRGGYAVTHAGSLRRLDEHAFTAAEASVILEAFTYLLSFSRGRHCAIGPVAGIDATGARSWHRWSIGKVHPHVPHELSASWFVWHEGEPLEAIFPEFLRRWSVPAWQEVLRLAIDLYATANTQESSQISLTIGQSVLELLAWTVLVEQRGAIRGEWDRIMVSDQLRLLLSMADIPIAIPTGLAELTRHIAQRKWSDGPHAVTDLRNAVIHPTKRRRDGLAAPDLPWEEVARLTLWYGELVLLRLMNYRGAYMSRLSFSTEAVPWGARPVAPLA